LRRRSSFFRALLFTLANELLRVGRGFLDEPVEQVPVRILAAELALGEAFLALDEPAASMRAMCRRTGLGSISMHFPQFSGLCLIF
jgi:hypothetical protein